MIGLCIVDVQEGILSKIPPQFLQTILDVGYAFERLNNSKIFFTRFINRLESPYVNWLGYKDLITEKEQALWSTVHKFTTCTFHPFPVFNKTSYSIWTPNLKYYLKQNNVTKIYFAGLDTDACIYQSALAAFEHDIEPFVIRDACMSLGGEVIHQQALRLLQRNIGNQRIVTIQTIFELDEENHD